MLRINGITNDSKQRFSIPLENDESAEITLSYNPRTQSWVIVSLQHREFILNGYKIYNSRNFLHQFRNLIPFGLACISQDDREPMLIDDFSSGNSVIYVLNSEETISYWRELSGSV